MYGSYFRKPRLVQKKALFHARVTHMFEKQVYPFRERCLHLFMAVFYLIFAKWFVLGFSHWSEVHLFLNFLDALGYLRS